MMPRTLRHRKAASAAYKAGLGKPMTRKEARAWLAPVRQAFGQMLQGEADAIRGYAVTRLHHKDDWARTDHCIAGFRCLIHRLMPDLDMTALARVEKKLAAGVLLTHPELEACMALFRTVEDRLLQHIKRDVLEAATTEQIAIELETLGLIQEAA